MLCDKLWNPLSNQFCNCCQHHTQVGKIGSRCVVLSLIFSRRSSDNVHAEQVKGVAEWLRAWDTLTMFEATVCGRS